MQTFSGLGLISKLLRPTAARIAEDGLMAPNRWFKPSISKMPGLFTVNTVALGKRLLEVRSRSLPSLTIRFSEAPLAFVTAPETEIFPGPTLVSVQAPLTATGLARM